VAALPGAKGFAFAQVMLMGVGDGTKPNVYGEKPWIDEKTGVLSGRPDTAGKTEVVITGRLEREVRKLDEKALVWGNEKVLSTTLERVGAATQKFIIDVP
jgi:predicted PP-loop superfamily ATPase